MDVGTAAQTRLELLDILNLFSINDIASQIQIQMLIGECGGQGFHMTRHIQL